MKEEKFKPKNLLYSVWLFWQHDFEGLYICTDEDEETAEFEILFATADCDPYISLGKDKLQELGKCIWQRPVIEVKNES